jgi:hypothetical protein
MARDATMGVMVAVPLAVPLRGCTGAYRHQPDRSDIDSERPLHLLWSQLRIGKR